jgi:hypothetical protein
MRPACISIIRKKTSTEVSNITRTEVAKHEEQGEKEKRPRVSKTSFESRHTFRVMMMMSLSSQENTAMITSHKTGCRDMHKRKTKTRRQ